jgi:hypothetical protein
MKKTICQTIAAVSACLLSVTAQAGVISSSMISLSQLQIVPATGTLQVQSPLTASAFGQAQDSLGGSDQHFNTVDDSATSASGNTALASGNGAASAPSRTASAASAVNISVDASASATGQGGLGPAFGSGSGMFQIQNATNTSVSVAFSALLNINQFLQTDSQGVFAFSEVIFQLVLPDLPDQPLLFFDNPITIGPSATSSFTSSPTLTNTVTLQTNTLYTLIALVDAESSGLNSVPEPSLMLLDGLGAGILCAYFGRRRKRVSARN